MDPNADVGATGCIPAAEGLGDDGVGMPAVVWAAVGAAEGAVGAVGGVAKGAPRTVVAGICNCQLWGSVLVGTLTADADVIGGVVSEPVG